MAFGIRIEFTKSLLISPRGYDTKELRIMNRPVRLQSEAKQGRKNDVRELKGRSLSREPKHKRHQGRVNKVVAPFKSLVSWFRSFDWSDNERR
jgi:hypothetical protein